MNSIFEILKALNKKPCFEVIHFEKGFLKQSLHWSLGSVMITIVITMLRFEFQLQTNYVEFHFQRYVLMSFDL